MRGFVAIFRRIYIIVWYGSILPLQKEHLFWKNGRKKKYAKIKWA